MKQRIPDQAESLRRMAEQESLISDPGDSQAAAVLDAPAPPEDILGDANALSTESSSDLSKEIDVLEAKPKETLEAKVSLDRPQNDNGNGALKTAEAKNEARENRNRRRKKKLRGRNNPPQQNDAKPETVSKPELAPSPEKADKKAEAKPSVVDRSSLLDNLRFPMKQSTQVIAITGGKGGVGKSNIACNLAIAMSQMGKRVMVMDADLSLANVDVLLGLTPRHNLSHVIRGEKTLREITVEGPAGIRIIPGGSGVEELSQLSLVEMNRLFEAFDGIVPVPDVFIIDTAAGIHPNVMQFLSAADQAIVVTTPEPTAYTDAYALIKTLLKHQNGKEIGLLVNMAQNPHEAAEVLRMMLQMCRQFLNLSFNNIGFVPRDAEVLKAVRTQKPFLLRTPNSPAAKTIRNIAATILQIEFKDKQPKGLRRFFSRIFSNAQTKKAAAS